MIACAAVRIYDKRQEKEIIMPVHRHYDAFYILKQLGYKKNIDYKEIAQGFLDEHDNFYTRIEAYKHAYYNKQIVKMQDCQVKELFSEDLW